jgi:hypothetical protein
VRRLAALAAAAVPLVAGVAVAGRLPATGKGVIGGSTVQLRYAAAFSRSSPDGSSGGYAVVLAAKPVRCSDLGHLPDENRIGSRWVLVSLYPTKDGAVPIGDVRGEIDYPVGDAYASLARGASITLATSGSPFPGAVWRGHVGQGVRKVEGKLYGVNVNFAARWCS